MKFIDSLLGQDVAILYLFLPPWTSRFHFIYWYLSHLCRVLHLFIRSRNFDSVPRLFIFSRPTEGKVKPTSCPENLRIYNCHTLHTDWTQKSESLPGIYKIFMYGLLLRVPEPDRVVRRFAKENDAVPLQMIQAFAAEGPHSSLSANSRPQIVASISITLK